MAYWVSFINNGGVSKVAFFHTNSLFENPGFENPGIVVVARTLPDGFPSWTVSIFTVISSYRSLFIQCIYSSTEFSLPVCPQVKV